MDEKNSKKNHIKDEEKNNEVSEVSEVKVENPAENLKKEAEEYKNRYLRALADYQNLEKRVRDERVELFTIAKANLITEFFPVIDMLQQAEIFIKDPGLKMVKDTFMQTMQELGVKEVELLGKQYDPHFAEVIDMVDGEKDDIIVEVLRNAYELNGKILRPGQVKVSKKGQN